MTNLVIGVTIKADGTGLIGQAKLSKSAVEELKAAAEKTGGALGNMSIAADKAAAASLRLQAAEARAASAADRLSTAHADVAASAGKSADEQARAASRVIAAEAALASAALSVRRAQEAVAKSSNSATDAANRHSFAVRNAGQQVGDFFTQVSSGANPITAFNQQIGQLAYAMSDMGGKAGKVGAFLVGPWGIALTVAAQFAIPLIAKLFESADAADSARDKYDKLAASADSFGNVQSMLGKIIDLSTGKFKTHNQVLIETIRLQAEAGLLQAKQDERAAKRDLSETPTSLTAGRAAARILNRRGGAADFSALTGGTQWDSPELRALFDSVGSGATDATAARIRLQELEKSGKTAGQTFDELFPKILKVLQAGNDVKANQDAINAIDGKGVSGDLTPYAKAKKTKAKSDTKTSAEAEEIQRINEEFDRTPSLVDKAAQATRKLDAIIADLTKRKPPGFEKLIADAETAKQVVIDGLQKPYLDYIEDQQQGLEVQRLIAAGRRDEADALKIILSLEKERGPLLPEQKDAILATVQAIRAEQHEIDVLREKTQKYTEALGSVRSAVMAVFTDPLQGLEKLPGRLLSAFKELNAKVLFDKIFGEAFRELQSRIDGTSTVKDASDRMSVAVDAASAAIGRLGTAAQNAAGQIADAPSSTSQQLFDSDGKPIAKAAEPADIVVTGDPLKQPVTFFASTITKLLKDGVGISQEAADTIGKVSGKVISGAATGTVAATVASSLFGIGGTSKSNQLGGAIGGAIGKVGGEALGKLAGGVLGKLGGPIGSVVGGVVGSLLGGLFTKSKTGGATISSSGEITTSGNSSSLEKAASGLANNVLSGVQQIAQQLGGTVGTLSPITIGTYGKNNEYRVNTTGGTTLGGSSKKIANVEYFASGEEGAAAALAYAIKLQVQRGAVEGLSDAVRQALLSSDNIDQALQEALNVQKVEALIGGVGYTLKKTFDTFDAQAKESLDLAKKYGLDTIAVEKATGEARTKLIADTLKASVGSLQDLLTSMTSGDLFEGSAVDKRTALLAQIADVRTKAEAGEEGAADTLSNLYQQLLSNTRDNFGTAGTQYSADRALVTSGAEAVIKAEQDRINQAAGIQQQTVAAIDAGNTLTNETNDLLAIQNAKIDSLTAALIEALDSQTIAGPNAVNTARADRML